MSAEPASNWKQSGSSEARCRLARKPKLRMCMKPRGSRCSRKRRRNSSSLRPDLLIFVAFWCFDRYKFDYSRSWLDEDLARVSLPKTKALKAARPPVVDAR